MKKRPLLYLAAGLSGLLCTMGSDCVPDPPDPVVPIGEPCTREDLPDCSHYGDHIIGIRPNCSCQNFFTPSPIDPTDPDEPGSGQVTMQLAEGWSFGGISSALPTVSLSGRSGPEATPTTSQPIEVIDSEYAAGTLDFSFEGPDPGFHTIAEMAQVAAVVNWDGPLTVTLTNPVGVTVSTTLPDWALIPVQIEDDCETRTLLGDVTQGPVTVKFAAHVDSPGCD